MPEPRLTSNLQLVYTGLLGGVLAAAAALIFASFTQVVRPHLGTSNTSAPIKVRGGSMTVRTSVQGGWKSSGSGFCSEIADASYLEFDDVQVKTSGAPTTLPPLETGWTLTILGRVFPGNTPSTNGIVITSQANNCAGKDPSKQSILISPSDAGSGNVAFYSDSQTLSDDGTSMAEKYEDMSQGCAGPNGPWVSGKPTTITGDEDVCERGSTITLKILTPTAQTYVYNCTNGECTIYIGKFS